MASVADIISPQTTAVCIDHSIGRNRMHYTASSRIETILSRLSDEEMEVAARASYKYLRRPRLDQRYSFAEHLAERVLESKNGDIESALAKLRNILEFRETAKIQDLIHAFDNSRNHSPRIKKLYHQLTSKKLYVQGFDKNGRSTLHFVPSRVVHHDIDSAVYSMERAIASTKSMDGRVNCIVDFSGFSFASHAPPFEIGKEFLKTLRTIYAGQIHKILLVNTPLSFQWLWKIFNPFIGTHTRKKILILDDTRTAESTSAILDLYDEDQIPSSLACGGKKDRPLAIDEYLFDIPFDMAFDDESNNCTEMK